MILRWIARWRRLAAIAALRPAVATAAHPDQLLQSLAAYESQIHDLDDAGRDIDAAVAANDRDPALMHRRAAIERQQGAADKAAADAAQGVPAGTSFFSDSFAAGDRRILMEEGNTLCGRFQFKYGFVVLDAQNRQTLRVQLESSDAEQPLWRQRHPDLAQAAGRFYTLDGYPNSRVEDNGAIQSAHVTFEMFENGEPTLGQLRQKVTAIARGDAKALSSTVVNH